MIFILSEENDFSTSECTEWLLHYDAEFLRWNEENFIQEVNIEYNKNVEIKLMCFGDKEEINLHKITKYWYRRGDFYLKFNKEDLPTSIKNHLSNEWKVIHFFLHNYLSEKAGLGNFFKEACHDKLLQLSTALDVGLEVPNTMISDRKQNLKNLKAEKIITKFLNTGISGKILGINFFSGGTNQINRQNVVMLDDEVFPTLIQEEIEKAYELRIFYMHEKFFPMAIFSQNNEKTKVDYRNYDVETPNRNIPYKLPESIKQKLITLTKKLGMNTGSIDMIVTPDDQFIFLEINHIGQFGWVSENCNYYLEKEIANWLINK